MTTTRDELHAVVDCLDEADLALWLAAFRDHDPVAWALLSAPFDSEPESVEEAGVVMKARKQVARGKVVTHESLVHELGL